MSAQRILFSVELEKCHHFERKKQFLSFVSSHTFVDIINEVHPSDLQPQSRFEIKCAIKDDASSWHEISDQHTTLGDVTHAFGVKFIKIICITDTDKTDNLPACSISKSSTVLDAFSVLMAGPKCYPEKHRYVYRLWFYSFNISVCHRSEQV